MSEERYCKWPEHRAKVKHRIKKPRWVCLDCLNIYSRQFSKTDRGIETRRRNNNSVAGRNKQRKYKTSEKGKLMCLLYKIETRHGGL